VTSKSSSGGGGRSNLSPAFIKSTLPDVGVTSEEITYAIEHKAKYAEAARRFFEEFLSKFASRWHVGEPETYYLTDIDISPCSTSRALDVRDAISLLRVSDLSQYLATDLLPDLMTDLERLVGIYERIESVLRALPEDTVARLPGSKQVVVERVRYPESDKEGDPQVRTASFSPKEVASSLAERISHIPSVAAVGYVPESDPSEPSIWVLFNQWDMDARVLVSEAAGLLEKDHNDEYYIDLTFEDLDGESIEDVRPEKVRLVTVRERDPGA